MAKKSFKADMETQTSGAAMAFISRPQDNEEAIERKTKRLNLLIKPSAYAALRKIAHMNRVSTNGLIDVILDDYIKANNDKVMEYAAIYGEEE